MSTSSIFNEKRTICTLGNSHNEAIFKRILFLTEGSDRSVSIGHGI